MRQHQWHQQEASQEKVQVNNYPKFDAKHRAKYSGIGRQKAGLRETEQLAWIWPDASGQYFLSAFRGGGRAAAAVASTPAHSQVL